MNMMNGFSADQGNGLQRNRSEKGREHAIVGGNHDYRGNIEFGIVRAGNVHARSV